jgi:acetyl-CoA C-acetyltransferase
MSLDHRLPVVIGAGQITHRAEGIDDALEPAALIEQAIRAATADAGLVDVPAPDVLRVVNLFSWRYGNPARVVADRMHLDPKELGYTTVGGNSPQSLVNLTAGQIQNGELDVAILAGAEAWRTRMRARRSDTPLAWATAPSDDHPVSLGGEMTMSSPEEIERGVVMPIQVYPMFESAIRAASGRSVDDHLVAVSELWARFSAVAAANEYAWTREVMTAEEIRTPSASNRLVGLPYTKVMNSNNDVDMGAAVIVCSAAAAERLGVATDRWVFVHAGSDCHEHPFVSNRDTFARTPAIEIGGRAALDLAAATIDDVALVDLYSCFPSAVQLGAASLGLSAARQLTRTGGLSFAGGPWNNYVMHAIATMVADAREQPGELGLVWANGGYVTKHSFGLYSTTPPAHGFRHATPQREIDSLPKRTLASPKDAAGGATVEAYTVMHDRDGRPERAIAACLLGDGRRAWATSGDDDTATALTDGEWVGRPVDLDSDGNLRAV